MKKILYLIPVIASLAFADTGSRSPRIISISPAATEILFGLGLDDNIIGDTTYCNYPPAAKTKEKVGSFSQPNIEKIVSLKPDVIFATGLEQARVVDQLKKLKIPVYVSDPSNLNDLYLSIKEIGKRTGREEEAEIMVSAMQSRIEDVRKKAESMHPLKKPKVFIEIWNSPLMTAGKGSFVDELITIAGGENVAYDTLRPYGYFSAEQVIKRDPDCIIMGYMDRRKALDAVGGRLGWSGINAVKNGRVYNDINPDVILRPGPRLAEGLEEIFKRLYQ